MQPQKILLCLFAVWPGFALSAPPELPSGTPEAIRHDLEIIEKYQEEVVKHTGNTKDKGRNPPLEPVPSTALPPASPNPPAIPEAVTRDPFEVSPRLREGKVSVSRTGPYEGTTLNKSLRLKAVVRGPGGSIAKVESESGGRKEMIIVQDGDELDLGGIRYIVKVEADGLTLHGAGAPQYRMLVR